MAQDYLLRMIQQVAAMLAGILAKRQAGDLAGAEDELQEKSLQYVGLPLVVVKHAAPEAILELLGTGGALRHSRGVLLAELLIQDAALAEARGNPPEALISYQLASRLLADSLGVLSIEEEAVYRAKLVDLSAKLRDLGDGTMGPDLPSDRL